MPDNIMAEAIYQSTTAALTCCAGRVDADGNLFLSWNELHGNDTVTIVQKHAPDGAVVGDWRVFPPTGLKTDFSTLMPGGSDLWIIMTVHQPISGPRSTYVCQAVLPGVFAPYPGGHDIEASAFNSGNLTPVPTQEDNVTIDYNHLADVVINRMRQEMAGNLGEAFQERVREVVGNSGGDLATKADLHASIDEGIYHSSGLYARLMETQFQVLRDNDVLRAAVLVLQDHHQTPTPHPNG